MEIIQNDDLILESTELDGDLLYLQQRHDVSGAMVEGLVKSPVTARAYFRRYKLKMRSICLLFVSMGCAFIVISVLRHEQWLGLVSGMLGSAIIVYAFSVYKEIKAAITKIEKIATYHELL